MQAVWFQSLCQVTVSHFVQTGPTAWAGETKSREEFPAPRSPVLIEGQSRDFNLFSLSTPRLLILTRGWLKSTVSWLGVGGQPVASPELRLSHLSLKSGWRPLWACVRGNESRIQHRVRTPSAKPVG